MECCEEGIDASPNIRVLHHSNMYLSHLVF
jgi:hypothetical protein